jgi:DNA-binding CsgD family transcriptional regulator
MFHLLGECCELGADPVAWQQHLAERLPVLFGGQMGQISEFRVIAPPFREPFWLQMLAMSDFGWATASDREPLEEHLKTGRPEDGPHITPDLLDRQLRTLSWSSNLGRTGWLNSTFFNQYVKHTHLDDGLFAHHRIGEGHFRWMFVNRALGDRVFSRRERRLMALLNRELARVWGTRLAPAGQTSVTALSPRLRDVLRCLMDGDSEKQVARRLGLSPHTVHDYVKSLHSRFGARSRGELLSRCRAYWPVLQMLEAQDIAPDGEKNGSDRNTPCSGE